ncbi:MAG TPA: tail fiber protein [Microbacterium sp.]|nr:tail fiber protein [Microbacterium sp.]
MSEAYLGEIRRVSFNFAPRNWAFCHGQILSIAQNQALFSLLGTQYGGNGTTTFALPDLRGRAPIHAGSSNWVGETGGREQVTLLPTQIPAHTHLAQASKGAADMANPQGGYWADSGQAAYGAGGTGILGPAAISSVGGNLPHENRPPYLVINYIIAVAGIYPSRN